jgi:hypothetical protein
VSASRLSLYNQALALCSERRLASLTEEREARRLLDDSWGAGAVDYCLEQGQWNFAMRSVKLDYSPSVEPPFGYRRAFDKPTDYIRTAAVSIDEFFREPLLAYTDEADYWFADFDTIYVRYVSNDDAYGNNMGRWPETFSKFVEAFLATEIVWKLTQSTEKRDKVEEVMKKCLVDARSKDSMNEPTTFAPRGSWTSARMGNRARRDRGNRGSLIG